MSISTNPILKTDSYKFSQWAQYPPGTTNIHSYIEARGSKIANVHEVTLFGLQSRIQDLLMTPVTLADVDEARRFVDAHIAPGVFNYEGWRYVVEYHGGYLPIRIEAVPEGSSIPVGNLMVRISAVDPKCAWAVSYVESAIIQNIWYGSTIATMSRHMKKTIKYYLDRTSDLEGELDFKLHDFGYRGVSSDESAGLGGAAHLVNFKGTDTVAGIGHAIDYYNAQMPAFSIAASEHSTMTSWGRENEYYAYENMVKQFARKGATFACVIDSYDTFNAVDLWTKPQNGNKSLVDQVRDAGATVVLRPDSGNPIHVPVEVVTRLMYNLSDEVTVNSKGYKVLPSHVRVIQGDGIDHDDVAAILSELELSGMSASNIAFGMGGGLLQKVNRDQFKFAMKASAAQINGEIVDVYKDPITDPGKKSKRGIITLVRTIEGEYKTVRESELQGNFDSTTLNGQPVRRMLGMVYSASRGSVYHTPISFDQVRKNAEL